MSYMPTKVLISADFVLVHEHSILLIKRLNPPYKDLYALPGGFVEPNETFVEAAHRELFEETGTKSIFSMFVGMYDQPDRDPRGRVVTAAYIGFTDSNQFTAGDDAKSAAWHSIDELPELAFDHAHIVRDALKLIGYK
jgi:8-oxo-dGTP diphosphatase